MPEAIATKQAERRAAVKSHKRALILDAAKAVFAEDGLDGASMRRIAAESGYTPAAIYFYFAGKEDIYAAILTDVLDELGESLKQASAGATSDEGRARAVVAALFAFYRERPREFELSYYLFQGVRPRGLTRALNDRLNALLKAALAVVTDALSALSRQSREQVWPETLGTLAQASGVVLLRNSGRLKVLGMDDGALEAQYIDGLIGRLTALKRS